MHADQTINAYLIYQNVLNSIKLNFGDYGSGHSIQSLQCKYYNNLTNIAIMKCSRDSHRMVQQAITLMNAIDIQPPRHGHYSKTSTPASYKHKSTSSSSNSMKQVRVQIIHIGATIMSCQRAAIKHNREMVLSLMKHYNDNRALRDVISDAPIHVFATDATLNSGNTDSRSDMMHHAGSSSGKKRKAEHDVADTNGTLSAADASDVGKRQKQLYEMLKSSESQIMSIDQ